MIEKIEKVLQEYKGNDELKITEASTFEELELDSLDTVEIVMSLEDEFGITIEVNDTIKSVGDLIKVISDAQ